MAISSAEHSAGAYEIDGRVSPTSSRGSPTIHCFHFRCRGVCTELGLLMMTLKNVLICCALVLVWPQLGLAQNSDEDIWSECRETNSCKIDYDRLANQKTDPFMFLGKAVHAKHPKWKNFRRSLRRYPDVRDCLIKDERTAETPNLLHFDWQRVGTGNNAAVCVFRIAASLGSVERTQAWLSYQGFRFGKFGRMVSESYQPAYRRFPIYNLTASWSAEQYREVTSSWFAALTGYDLISSYTLVLSFDQFKRIAEVSVSTRSKLN